jgi:hypothetical protein
VIGVGYVWEGAWVWCGERMVRFLMCIMCVRCVCVCFCVFLCVCVCEPIYEHYHVCTCIMCVCMHVFVCVYVCEVSLSLSLCT